MVEGIIIQRNSKVVPRVDWPEHADVFGLPLTEARDSHVENCGLLPELLDFRSGQSVLLRLLLVCIGEQVACSLSELLSLLIVADDHELLGAERSPHT